MCAHAVISSSSHPAAAASPEVGDNGTCVAHIGQYLEVHVGAASIRGNARSGRLGRGRSGRSTAPEGVSR